MIPSLEDKVRIYAAARSALQDAARTAFLGGDDDLGEIAVEVIAAAGMAAFEESRRIMVAAGMIGDRHG